MRLTSALILFDLMFLTLLWIESIKAFSLMVLLINTFVALNPKIGLSSGSLITKNDTCNSSTVLVDSSGKSNFISLYGYPTELVVCYMGLTVPQLLKTSGSW